MAHDGKHGIIYDKWKDIVLVTDATLT